MITKTILHARVSPLESDIAIGLVPVQQAKLSINIRSIDFE